MIFVEVFMDEIPLIWVSDFTLGGKCQELGKIRLDLKNFSVSTLYPQIPDKAPYVGIGES